MIGSIVDGVVGLLDKFIPDADTKYKLANEVATLATKQAHEIAMAQIEVNKAEAERGNIFQSGWRPAVGWTCVLGLIVNFLISPIAGGFGVDLPQADMSVMMPLLLGLLGLGGLRTYEKTKGVAKP